MGQKTFAERIKEKIEKNKPFSVKEKVYDYLSKQENPVTYAQISEIFERNEKGFASWDRRRRELHHDLAVEFKKIEQTLTEEGVAQYQIVNIPQPKTKTEAVITPTPKPTQTPPYDSIGQMPSSIFQPDQMPNNNRGVIQTNTLISTPVQLNAFYTK